MGSAQSLDYRGCSLSYKVRGEGPPVLFIQGTGTHGDGWRPQVDELSGRFRCLTFDNRGMGNSQPHRGPLTVEQMAEDARALLDSQGWASAHVVGHSLGGLIALQLALDAPRRIRSLSLLCTFARGRDAAPLTPWMLWTGMRTRIGTRRMRRHAFLKLVMPPSVLAMADRDALGESLASLFGHDIGDLPPIVNAQLMAMRACNLRPRLAELANVPALVMSAEHDRIAPPNVGRALAEGMARARFVEIPDAAHGLPIQLAGRVNESLAGHFDGVC